MPSALHAKLPGSATNADISSEGVGPTLQTYSAGMRIPWRRDDQREPATVVLGAELAAARDAEQLHQTTSHGPSPLGGLKYDPAAGELSLFRFEESAVDDQVAAVVGTAFSSDNATLASARDAMTQDDLYTLLAFARRRAVATLRERDCEHIEEGFTALALVDSDRVDWRDAAVAAGLLAYAGRTMATLEDAVERSSRRALAPMSQIIRTHASRPSNGLAAGGFREVTMPWGVSLVSDYGQRYEPNSNLLTVAAQVIAAIETDAYVVSDVTTGTDLPKVWLPSASPDALDARARIAACLSVSARPQGSGGPMSQHMLVIFIGEAANEGDAELLADAARRETISETASFGVSTADRFAVCVARPVVKGVDPLEDGNSISRFRAPLMAAMAGR